MQTFILKSSSKVRLDVLLRENLPVLVKSEISNSKLRRLIISGSVLVNGKQIFVPSYLVFPESEVKVRIDEERLFFEKQPDDIDFTLTQKDVLYEDDFIIVVNKPSHLPTEATIVESRKSLHDAAVDFLFARQKVTSPNAKNPPYVGIMHRLDRDTSGAILFSKSRSVNKALHDAFENRKVKKTYVAVVCGVPKQEKFSVGFPMGRISPKSQAAKWGSLPESKGGVLSKTDFELLKISSFQKNFPGVRKSSPVEKSPVLNSSFCVLDCFPYTGRTHQIRVHLASVNLPILGDTLYGGKTFGRIMLHSKSLEFPHPVSGETVKVDAPLSEEFNDFLL